MSMNTAAQLAAFAGVLWRCSDLIEIRPLPAPLGARRWVRADELAGLAETLQAENQAGANLYAGVLPRTQTGLGADSDCTRGRILWADFDHTSPEDAMQKAKSIWLPAPSCVVNSGHGAHLYWRLKKLADPAVLAALVGTLALALGSDPSVKNPSRIMRLPGFVNHKAPAAPAVLLHHSPAALYAIEEIQTSVEATIKAKAAPASSPAATRPTTGAAEVVERARRYVTMVQGSTEGGRHRASYRAAAVLANDFALCQSDALTLLCEWNQTANSPPLDEKELTSIINGIGKYAKKPAGNKATSTLIRPPTKSGISLPSDSIPSALRSEFESEGRGDRRTVGLPWSELERESQLLRPGTVAVLGGPAGYGKSFFALEMLAHVHSLGEKWALLPLEDRRVDVERRLLAHLSGDWSVIYDSPEFASRRIDLLAQHEKLISEMIANVAENPRLPVPGADGKLTVPPVPFEAVLDWVGRTPARVVVIDPWAQIDFGDQKSWIGEKAFIRKLVGIAAHTGATVMVVAHTIKRGGNNKAALSGEDLQGAAELKRLSHTILILEAHEPKETSVYGSMAGSYTVTHNRTLLIDKARNGSGGGHRYAFSMESPRMEEKGRIKMTRKNNNRNGG
jgi:hypothetical protein